MSELFYEINKGLCDTYSGLDPLKLLDYPAEDVIELINGTLSYNKRNKNNSEVNKSDEIRRQAGDDWF